jgi:hypothetical protein
MLDLQALLTSLQQLHLGLHLCLFQAITQVLFLTGVFFLTVIS